jgi:hypothetical protein
MQGVKNDRHKGKGDQKNRGKHCEIRYFYQFFMKYATGQMHRQAKTG